MIGSLIIVFIIMKIATGSCNDKALNPPILINTCIILAVLAFYEKCESEMGWSTMASLCYSGNMSPLPALWQSL